MKNKFTLALILSILIHFSLIVLNKSRHSNEMQIESVSSWTLEKGEENGSLKHKVTSNPEAHAPSAQTNASTNASTNVENSPSAGVSSAGDSTTATGYLDRLRDILNASKFYPKSAQIKREQGTAVVSFEISNQGEFSKIKIVQSSRFDELDEAALSIVRKKNHFDPLPSNLSAPYEVRVPIEFKL